MQNKFENVKTGHEKISKNSLKYKKIPGDTLGHEQSK
jgi:hypothetical protein